MQPNASKIIHAGIDVSAKTLMVAYEKPGSKQVVTAEFDNSAAGHKLLTQRLVKKGYRVKIALEATGIYHLDVALYLHAKKTVDVAVLNPKAAKHFATASMKRAKTDKVDAGSLLSYVTCMPFTAWQAPSKLALQLQAMSRRIKQVKGTVAAEKNRLHAVTNRHDIDTFIQHDIDAHIKQMEERLTSLQDQALRLIACDTTLTKQFELITSIKGIATTSGLQILAELVCLPKDMQAQQWVAYAGLDPKAVESGSSVKQSRRISKSGNRILRTTLYMPALVAIQKDKHVKAFYNKLIAKGKFPKQAIIAVMRKLLHAIWGILRTNTPWDNTRFCQLETVEQKTQSR